MPRAVPWWNGLGNLRRMPPRMGAWQSGRLRYGGGGPRRRPAWTATLRVVGGGGVPPVAGLRRDADPQLQFPARLPPAPGDQQMAQNPAGAGLGIRLAFARPFADVVAQRQFAEVRPALQKIHVGVEDAPERFSRGEDQLAGTEGALDAAAKGVQFAHRNRVEDLLPVDRESVERAHRNSRLPGNPAGGDLFEGHAPEQPGCRVEDLLHGFVAARLERRPAAA